MEYLLWPQRAVYKKERSHRHTALDSAVSTKSEDLPWLLPPHAAALTLWNLAVVQRCHYNILHAARKCAETGSTPAGEGP